MIRLGQHRHVPRQRLIGPQGMGWLVQAAHGAGLLLFLTAAVLVPQYLPLIKAWADGLRLAIVAGGHTTFLN